MKEKILNFHTFFELHCTNVALIQHSNRITQFMEEKKKQLIIFKKKKEKQQKYKIQKENKAARNIQ
jgi:ribosomal protein L24